MGQMMMSVHKAVVVSLLAAAACGKGSSEKTAGIELFGKRPIPPGDLAKVKPDMTQAEVKALFPKAKPTPNHSGSPSLSLDSGYSNAEFRIGFYSDKDAVAGLKVEVPKALGDKLESAWGPPKEKSPIGPTWRDDEAGYEVQVWDMGRESVVDYRPFTPITAEFFGAKPGPIDVFTKLKFGMTRDEVSKAVPGLEGAPKGGGGYIPLKAKPDGVTMHVGFDYETDLLSELILEMPGRGIPALLKAWGPREGKTRGTNDPMHCWETADKSMRIELDETDPKARTARVTFIPYLPDTRGFCVLPGGN